jgi:single-strand DNA-binding protein
MAVRSLNKVMLIGNLTRDPNLRYTPNGTAVCSFGLATNRSWASADGGEKQERVEFHNVVSWAKLAEICGQLLHKGDKVYLEGRLQTREWKGDDDQSRRTTEVVIDNMILLRSAGGYSGGKGDDANDIPEEPVEEEATPAKDQVEETEDVADDIPF